ncbi:MAG: hisC1 [Oscillospiraceae bacterium]|nr:hisC1 [Oscillospiraceae bacterium]
MPLHARPALEQFSSYAPARSLESIQREYGFERVIKLAGNENNLGYSPLAKKALAESLEGLSYYPDPYVTRLRETLAQRLHVEPAQLIFGTGSFSLISLVAQAFINPGEEAIMADPSFGWYAGATTQMDGVIIKVPLKDHAVDLDAIKARITGRTRVIWLCNPNNPTGTQFGRAQFDRFLEGIRDDIIIVLDEAYLDFSEDADFANGLHYINQHHNIISLRTFSKLYGLASFRIGYGIASEELISLLTKAQLPICVNHLAQVAALASLEDTEFVELVQDNARKSKQLYYQTLETLGLDYIKTNGNFIMFDVGTDSDDVVLEFLKKGILVRGGKEFGMPTWLRVSIGIYEENQLVLTLLTEILERSH